ncbi:hypothetical protein SOPP22_17510 [Shewanella sp. OPT22]|nr:hypothetical protein SOPP22_17510 [Shewanella sp. OPT22]
MELARKNNSRVLLVLALVFIAPVVLAKLFLAMHWYQGGVTNKGQLLPDSMTYQSLKMKNPAPHHWQVIYMMPDECTQKCQQQLFVLNQSYLALGKDKNRVTPVVLHQQGTDALAMSQYKFTQAVASKMIAKQMDRQQMVVVDPLGKLVTCYDLMPSKHEQVMQGRALLNDLHKMLKLSRVG